MKVTAKLKNLRTSPRKVRLVANLIKGMDANAAVVQLNQTTKKSGDSIEKLLKSAISNAVNNFGLDQNNLYVSDIQVGEGTRLKRWLPRAHGRATLLLKRMSQINLTLEEKVEGKNRKSKDEMEKERKAREAAKEKAIKEAMKEMEAAEKEAEVKETKEVKPVAAKARTKKGEAKTGQDNGFLKKVFNRKSV